MATNIEAMTCPTRFVQTFPKQWRAESWRAWSIARESYSPRSLSLSLSLSLLSSSTTTFFLAFFFFGFAFFLLRSHDRRVVLAA